MGSLIRCVCGGDVRTNIFEGHKVYRLVQDDEFDRLRDSGVEDLASQVFLGGREVFRCPSCARLIVFWERTGPPTFYTEEHHKFDDKDDI